jgi:hypothetical protein
MAVIKKKADYKILFKQKISGGEIWIIEKHFPNKGKRLLFGWATNGKLKEVLRGMTRLQGVYLAGALAALWKSKAA